MASGFSHFRNEVIATGIYHARVHQGLYFSADHIDLSMADNDVIEILLQVNSNAMHLRQQYQATATATLNMYEGTTFSAAGTVITPVSRNREHQIVPSGVVTHTPTLDTDGTLIDTRLIPGGSGGNAQGGEGAFAIEWELAPNTVYLFRGQNLGGNAQAGHLHVNWYEEIPGLPVIL